MFFTPKEMRIDNNRINEIVEELWNEENKNISSRCPDCGVKPGEYHLENCDVAICGNCRIQLITCRCKIKLNSKWDGLWPGYKECYEQKLICYDDGHNMYEAQWRFDLNTLAKLIK